MKLEKRKQHLRDYLDGKLNEQEQAGVDAWYESIARGTIEPFKNKEHKEEVRKALFDSLQAHVQPTKRRMLPFSYRALVAAAALLLLATFAFLWINKIHRSDDLIEIQTHAGEVKQHLLPDSTVIWLGGNTQLSYHKAGYAKNRNLTLERGEAFFDVHRDTLHPFRIASGDLTIQVLGTSFNVRHFKESHDMRVDVKTGVVKVSQHKSGLTQILKKGEGLAYDSMTQTFVLTGTTPDYVDLWTRGGIFFQQASFKDLQELLNNRFGVHLASEGLNTADFRYTLLMPNVQSLEHIMDMICSIHQLKYRRKNHEVILYQ